MTDVRFHATRMGRTFYERTMPELVKASDRLAKAVEAATGPENDEDRS